MPEQRDDPSISDSELLWRRVHPFQIDWKVNPARVSSGAFNTANGLSVSIASETTLTAITIKFPEDSVVQFEVSLARSLGCKIERDPTDDDASHALVWGPKAHGRLSKTQMDNLRNACIPVHLSPPNES